jgi:prevent-host-death family protein
LTHMTKKAVSLAEAKSHLSELVVRAAYGNEEFLITRRGKPAALLTSARPKNERAPLADVKGWLDNHDPFFESLENVRRDSRKRGPRILR